MQDKSNTVSATSTTGVNVGHGLAQTRKSVASVRLFLTIAAVLLAVVLVAAFTFVVFLLTRDLNVTVGCAILGAIIATVCGLLYSGER
jgi:beta-lactamase regulating signal transducer with metallopeptidase domain